VNPQCQVAVDTVSPPVVVNDDAQEAYQILDFRLTWTSSNGHFDVAGFVNNLTDKDIIQSQVVGSAQIGAPVQVRFDRPRTWGIRFGMSW
jgi:outer membrane receptor protein involved in Fe transport